MVYLYSDDDLYQTYRQRGRILAFFFGVLAFYLVGLSLFIYFYTTLAYGDPNGSWVIAGAAFFTVAVVLFLFPYMGIKYKRCNCYYKMLKYISVGLKDCTVAPFVGLENWMTREGVDLNVACFGTRGGKRGERLVRQIYVDGEKDYPPFNEGDVVRFVSQGNLLLAYEVVKQAEPSAEDEITQ